jgi:hypothetical protein
MESGSYRPVQSPRGSGDSLSVANPHSYQTGSEREIARGREVLGRPIPRPKTQDPYRDCAYYAPLRAI